MVERVIQCPADVAVLLEFAVSSVRTAVLQVGLNHIKFNLLCFIIDIHCSGTFSEAQRLTKNLNQLIFILI